MKNTLETRLGIFFALALVASVIILEMVGVADFFKTGYRIHANCGNAHELKKGDLVKMAGVEIGRVEEIRLEEGRAHVTMKIKGKPDDTDIRTDSKAIIKFTGLMGQNFVSIEGGTTNAARALPGAVLVPHEQPDLSALMTKLEGVATGIQGLTESFKMENLTPMFGPITDFVKQNTGPLTATIANMKTVSDQVATGKGSVGRLLMDDALYNSAFATITNFQSASADVKGFIGDAQGMIGQARKIIDNIEAGQGTLGKLTKDEALYTETTTAMTNLREILEKINKGQGSVGKLVNDDSFLKNAKLSLQKLDKVTEGLANQGPLSVLGIAINSLF